MKRMILILMITILVIIAGYKIYSVHIAQEYQKYCTLDCEATHVSKSELDNIKATRLELAITNITEYQDNISSTKQRLSNYDLNDEQQSNLDKANVSSEYNPNLTYSVDELIELEKEYKKASDEVDQIEFDYSKSTYQNEISEYKDEINQDIDSLEQFDLSADDKQVYDELKDELNTIDYDGTASYDLDQLNSYAKEYKGLAKKFHYLATY